MFSEPRRAAFVLLKAVLLSALAGMATVHAGALSIGYHCVFPLLVQQPLNVDIRVALPASVPAGTQTAPVEVSGIARVNDRTRDALRYIGARELRGTVEASALLRGPGRELELTIPLQISPASIPDAEGGFQASATGRLPALTFGEDQVGEVVVSVDELILTLKPVDHRGEPTGLGEFESECRPEAGQSRVLHRLVVTGPAPEEAMLMRLDGRARLSGGDEVLPLKGTLEVGGDADGDGIANRVSLAPTRLSLDLLSVSGLLTLVADLRFEAAGAGTQSLADARLDTQSPLTLRVPWSRLRLFGFDLAAGGADCRAREPAQLRMTTPAGERFDPVRGGPLSGELDIPALTDCGGIEALLNEVLSGAGNPVDVQLTPASS